MSKSKNYHKPSFQSQVPKVKAEIKKVNSVLDEMVDDQEYESILTLDEKGVQYNVRIDLEFKKALREISDIRGRPNICYVANVIKPPARTSIAIDPSDDLPFAEMVDSIDKGKHEIDIILATPGGSAEQVAKFVDKLRPRFSNVQFILPFVCMSAGTMFCLSGDEVIMDSRAYIGPIDPQVPSREGYVPAQALQVLVKDIQKRGEEAIKRGEQPDWTDLQLLNTIDQRILGNSISASKYGIELVSNYLENYKFKNWIEHKNGNPVTNEERKTKAIEIAGKLCNHEFWKIHSRGISRDLAYSECGIKMLYPEKTEGLLRSIRRLWALAYFAFDRSGIAKILVSENYSIIKSSLLENQQGGLK